MEGRGHQVQRHRVTTRNRHTSHCKAKEICIDGARIGDVIQTRNGEIYWYARSDKHGVRLRNTAVSGIEYKSLTAAVTAATDYVKSELKRV